MSQQKGRRGRVVCAAALLASVAYMQAQSQTPQSADLQELKVRLQRLEHEVQDLKGEIDAAERSRQTPPVAATTPPPIPPPPPLENQKASTEQEKSESTIDLYG